MPYFMMFGYHFTKGVWAYNCSLVNMIIAVLMILAIQPGHKFAHVTAAQLSWHVQNWDLIG